MKYFRVTSLLTVATLAIAPGLAAQAAESCSKPRDVCAFFATFVSAFNRRDWVAFKATLDPDISVIFDRPGPAHRQDGHDAVESVFRLIFPDTPAATPSQIRPQQLQVQDFGNVVVLSFHLPAGEAVGRRTLVLHRTAKGWKVVHIHGSSSPSGD